MREERPGDLHYDDCTCGRTWKRHERGEGCPRYRRACVRTVHKGTRWADAYRCSLPAREGSPYCTRHQQKAYEASQDAPGSPNATPQGS